MLPVDPTLNVLPEELARLPVELARLLEETLLGLLPLLDEADDGGEMFC